MKVFKFGGASVKDADAIRNVAQILSNYNDEKILVVVSAMGKTTNALEVVYKAYLQDGIIDHLVDDILNDHLEFCAELFDEYVRVENRLIELFSDLMIRLEKNKLKSSDFIYDLIVSRGEMMSSIILQEFIAQESGLAVWLDATSVIKTDDNHRAAKVDWAITQDEIGRRLPELFKNNDLIITQGFIGSTIDNDVVTLGREGSDYTGAIFAFCADIRDYYVWKDVDGIMSADPRIFPEAVLLPQLSYREAIEMTYFGAKVIHPKTIQPLQRKGITLHVRSFTNAEATGTRISHEGMATYPPIIIYEPNQCLLNIAAKDFSFIAEDHLAEIFALLSLHSIKINMMQNRAVSFSLCISDNRGRINQVINELSINFDVESFLNLDLYTVRHFNEELLQNIRLNRKIYLEENRGETKRIILA